MEHLKLKALMSLHKLKQSDIADKLGIDLSTFNLKINGKRDFTITEIEKIKALFNLPYEEIFFDVKIHDAGIKSA